MTLDTVKAAYENGINYFDTAEIYGFGQGEESLGLAFEQLKIPREKIVVSTKIFKVGLENVNDCFLSRKHVVEGLKNSLKRLKLDYVDIVFAHRYDSFTSMEEICRAFDHVINRGWAFYWGTSEWEPSQIMEAFAVCEKLNLIKPVVEQCQYNMLWRERVEKDYVHLFKNFNYATTVWSPLFSGVLTGKYLNNEIPKGSRFDVFEKETKMVMARYLDKKEEYDEKIKKLLEFAKKLGVSMAQLALAWVIRNPDVTTCILGTSKVEQLHENLKSLEVLPKITHEVESEIEKILNNTPLGEMNWRDFSRCEPRRTLNLKK